MATYVVHTMEQALKALDEGEPDDDGSVYLEADFDPDAADALDLAAWFVSTIGVETVEEQQMQDWLAGLLVKMLDIDAGDAEDLAEEAAEAVAERLGLADDLNGHAYPDEGMVSDPYLDLVHEAIEHTNGNPGQLFREVATQLRSQ